jgi:hypothetical protein
MARRGGGKLARKNLVVDAGKIRELARRRGTSESEAVRQVVDFALAADEVVAIFDDLVAHGGIDDVFGKLSTDDDQEAAVRGTTATRLPATLQSGG